MPLSSKAFYQKSTAILQIVGKVSFATTGSVVVRRGVGKEGEGLERVSGNKSFSGVETHGGIFLLYPSNTFM